MLRCSPIAVLVDAAIIAAPSSSKNAEGERDPEMQQTKEGNQWRSGHRKASIRAVVEHPFRVIKRQFGMVKVRFRGPQKNTAQLLTLFARSNLWMATRGAVRLKTAYGADQRPNSSRNRRRTMNQIRH